MLSIDSLVNMFIRPTRHHYSDADLGTKCLVGPKQFCI